MNNPIDINKLPDVEAELIQKSWELANLALKYNHPIVIGVYAKSLNGVQLTQTRIDLPKYFWESFDDAKEKLNPNNW